MNVRALGLLRTIESEHRSATDSERAELVRYTGWGGLPQVFASAKEAPKWRIEQEMLTALLTTEEYTAARATVLNAHYTSPTIIRAIYAGLERLGFTHGRILEPACGLGHFFGLMPEEMARRSELTGIEIDPLTARLAAQLYPSAAIRALPFESAQLASNSFDLAVSNVPFGDYSPYDPYLNPGKFRIHDYFFLAALERVRSGGLVAFITSRGTMDKRQSTVREAIAVQADLVAAFRLPNTAFKANANTEVTTDILFLRKRAAGESPSGVPWLATRPLDVGGPEPIPLNEYYHAHPEHLLGRMIVASHGMYGRNEPELADDGRDLAAALASAMLSLPANIYQPATNAFRADHRTTRASLGVKPFAYTLTELGEIARREGDELVVLDDVGPALQRRIRGLIRVRDAVRECLRSQVENDPEAAVLASRERLNLEYDQFTAQHGPFSQLANYRAFSGDPDLPLLLSLENYDEESNTATKAAIFHERTIQPRTAVQKVATAKEAIVVTLSERGRVDLPHMAALLGRPDTEFLPELRGLLFVDPEAPHRWLTDDEYLSGDVRHKLAIAERAAERNPALRENVAALRAVQPADLKPTEIDARLGAVWIPTADIERFIRETLALAAHDRVRVSHVPEHALWTITLGHVGKHSVANTTEWGTDRAPAHELIESALNLRTPTIYDYDADRKPILNPTATEAAREKQQKLKDRFVQWIFTDDERRERLVAHYNRDFNCYRVRTFNGEHLSLPGASATINLRPHQKAAVWRILQSPNVLLAHVVGSGRTFTMCAAAMELKRLGLARKPMIVIPNHMLGQFSSEFLLLYPGANILVASRDNFEGDGRRRLMSRIATGNWDAVIVTHSGFERLPISPEARRTFMQQQVDELEERIRQLKGDDSDTRIVKQLESAKKRLKVKLEEMGAAHRKDNTLSFEELGVDRLFVDEAQAFKNLFYVTKMTRVANLPQTASSRAFDMLLKVRHVQQGNQGGGVVFATGTPVTNTMAEMFTMQRYLQPEVLQRQRLSHFDSWAATFGETVTAMELAPHGAGYRLNTRFARFVNVPELMQLFRQMADVQTADMLNLPTPALDGGRARVVSAPCSPELKAFVATLAKRAERLKNGHFDPREDNMLKITGEGRKAALDLRLVRSGARDHADSKINQAVREIHAIWQSTHDNRSTQLVFCDLSTPKIDARVFSAYKDIRAKLIAAGVPSADIAFIQEHDSDAAKLTLFKDVRSGRVRILLGSTQKMGAGTNVQAKLIALHHLDAPWRPADIEQREGRILRQGNSNATVRILRYVTAGSFDAYMWQTLETKAKFISQVMKGECTARRIEDLESPALTYAEVKAIASGNPAVIEKAKVDAELMRLTRLQAEHAESQFSSRRRVRFLADDAMRLERSIVALRKDLTVRRDTHGDAFHMTIDGTRYTERPRPARAAGTRAIPGQSGVQSARPHRIARARRALNRGPGLARAGGTRADTQDHRGADRHDRQTLRARRAPERVDRAAGGTGRDARPHEKSGIGKAQRGTRRGDRFHRRPRGEAWSDPATCVEDRGLATRAIRFSHCGPKSATEAVSYRPLPPMKNVLLRFAAIVAALSLVVGPSAAATLRNSDITKMAEAELPDSTIIAAIRANDAQFDLGADALIALKKARVSSAVIEAMLASAAPRPAPAAPATGESANPAPPAGPTVDGFTNILRAMAQQESRGAIELMSLRKINGQASTSNGVPQYWLKFQLTLRVVQTCRWLMVSGDTELKFAAVLPNPKAGKDGWDNFLYVTQNPGISVDRGQTFLVEGAAYLEKTEQGWQISRLTRSNLQPIAGDVLRTERTQAEEQPAASSKIDPAIALPLPQDQFAAECSQLPNQPVTPPAPFASKSGFWTGAAPSGELAPMVEVELDGATVARFATPGTTTGGIDGDMIIIRFRKRLGFQLREVTNEAQLDAELKVLPNMFQSFTRLQPTPITIAGFKGGYCLLATGISKGSRYTYATAFHISKKHLVHVSMFARAEHFASVWEQYRNTIASLKILLSE